MTDTVHKGQKQVVEGSAVGEFYVVPKFAYNCYQQVEYMGEAKVSVSDHVSRHFIQKLEYDCVGNVERILIATNKSTVDSNNVDVTPIIDTQVKITLNNGDFDEVNKGDALYLKTSLNNIMGSVYKIISSSQVIIEHSQETYTPELAVDIDKKDLTVTFKNDKTKDYTKRKWSNRERYFYKTV